MAIRTIVAGVLLLGSAWAAAADAGQRPAATCDRECLRGKVTQLLYALVKHDVSGLNVADTLRVPRMPSRSRSPRSASLVR